MLQTDRPTELPADNADAIAEIEILRMDLDKALMRISLIELSLKERLKFEGFLRQQVMRFLRLQPDLETFREVTQTWQTLARFPGGQVGAAFVWSLVISILGEMLIQLFS